MQPRFLPIALHLILLLLLLPHAAMAMPEVVTILPGHGEYRLGKSLELLEDHESSLSITEVSSPELNSRFVRSTRQAPGFGFTRSTVWARFTIENRLPERIAYSLEVHSPLLDHLTLFIPGANNDFSTLEGGDRLPFASRAIQYRNPIFSISLGPGEQQTFYLRCQTTSSLTLPLTLHSPSDLAGQISSFQSLIGLYCGILLVMMLYNLFIYVSIREIPYLHYVLFVASFLLFQLSLNGMAFQYFWPEHVWWANTSVPFFIFLSYVWAGQFTRSMLNTARNVPRLDMLLKGCILVAILGLVLSLFVGYALSIKVATLLVLSVWIHILAGYQCMRQGYRPAIYYFIAWSVSLLGMSVYALKAFGFLPHVFLTQWGIQIGSAWEVILLSMGLADRFYLMKQEKEQVQDEGVRRMSKTHAALERSFHQLERFKLGLEAMVEERTSDLQRLNVELAGEALKRRKAETEAEEANKAKSQFLAAMSHEIRTPMNAILGMAGLALKTAPTDKLRQQLGIIQDAGKALLGLINDILDFSKIEAGRLDLECINFDLREVLEGLADLFAKQTGEKGLELILTVDHDLPCAMVGDPTRLRQILINLVNNAIKFTQQGEITVSASCRQRNAENASVEFSVRDTGNGINHEQIKKLFSEYSQADTSTARLYGGTGLGLAISRQLVTLMGGEIGAESTPDQGSTFRFHIPMALQPEELQHSLTLPPEHAGARVLLAAHHPALAASLAAMLHGFGCTVQPVASGNALAAACMAEDVQQHHDLLVIDCGLDGLDLPHFLSLLRGQPGAMQLPVIVLTSLEQEVATELLGERATVLTKPVKESSLYGAVHHAVQACRGLESFRPPPNPSENQPPAAQPLAGHKILLVEDDPPNQKVISQLLTNHGILVDIAANGQEAIDALLVRRYDAVLMDVSMPVMDGLTATQAIRQTLKLDTPIIAITANVVKGDQEQCLAAGMNDFLGKPIETETLWAVLARWLPPGNR